MQAKKRKADAATSTTTIIRNGRVIDPASGLDEVCDVVVQDDKIVAVGSSSAFESTEHQVFDATGKIVANLFSACCSSARRSSLC